MAGKISNMLLGSWYVGSKFAVEGMSDSLRQELKPFGIDVAIIEPGAIQSEWKDGAVDRMMAASGSGPYASLARRSAASWRCHTNLLPHQEWLPERSTGQSSQGGRRSVMLLARAQDQQC